MRKFINIIITGLTGALTFVLLGLSAYTVTVSALTLSNTTSVSGYEIIKKVFEDAGSTWAQIGVITEFSMFIIAIAFVIVSVLMLLSTFQVTKSKEFDKIVNITAICVAVAFVAVSILSVVSWFAIGTTEVIGISASTAPGIGTWLILATSVISFILLSASSKLQKRS